MSDRQHHKIPVNISPGMFTDEYVVEINLPSGGTASLFTDSKHVKDIDVGKKTGWLLVEAISRSPEGEEIIVLPSESIELGTTWLKISPSQLQVYDIEQHSDLGSNSARPSRH